MSSQYKLEGPAIISFSGGRTSGMMLWSILDAHGGKLPEDVRVLFANTGREMPETLDFVHECSERWDVKITWLEYADHDKPQRRWREVTYETASRAGEPFSSLIGRKRLLPNPVKRICTSELKIRVMKLYAQQVLDFKHWDVAIGYRADEQRRVAKLSAPHRDPYDRCALLESANVRSSPTEYRRQDDARQLRPMLPEGGCAGIFTDSRRAWPRSMVDRAGKTNTGRRQWKRASLSR